MAIVSNAFIELQNLSNLAHHHKKVCDSEDCNISILLLKQSADRLLSRIYDWERNEAQDLLNNWPK